mmetsp:Transcript_31157/g.80498  ORF Transcript_31157/g.80498 Transcript_31157/m.80498 type:complete len:214 (-) Transcript_31157:290-931(-)
MLAGAPSTPFRPEPTQQLAGRRVLADVKRRLPVPVLLREHVGQRGQRLHNAHQPLANRDVQRVAPGRLVPMPHEAVHGLGALALRGPQQAQPLLGVAPPQCIHKGLRRLLARTQRLEVGGQTLRGGQHVRDLALAQLPVLPPLRLAPAPHLFGGFAGGVQLAWSGSAIPARPRGAHGEVAARADAATLRVQAAVLREAVPLLALLLGEAGGEA